VQSLEAEQFETGPEALDLLDELPVGEGMLASAPDDVLRQLFQTFRLEVRFDKPSHLANCRVTIDDDSVAAIASNADDTNVFPRWCTDVGSAPGGAPTRRERARPGVSRAELVVVGGFEVVRSPWSR
jgi:hypothetical protein